MQVVGGTAVRDRGGRGGSGAKWCRLPRPRPGATRGSPHYRSRTTSIGRL